MPLLDTLKLSARRLKKAVRNPQGKPAIVKTALEPRRFEQYCFVAGLHRSGTTLIEQMLEAHCDVCTLRADVPENEGQHLQDLVPAARDVGGPGRFAFSPQMYTTPPGPDSALQQSDRLLRCWTPWMTGSARTLLEKSPPNLVRIPWLRALFPGARFLIVMRDPRVAAAATLKWSRDPLEAMVYHWHVAYAAAHAAAGEDCVFLRYEDLCADPQGELDRIIDGLGLTRRGAALPVADRFASIANSNAKYLETLEPIHFGPGIWDRFGYDLSELP